MESHHQIFALYSRNYKRGSSRLHFEIKGWNFGNLKNKFRKRSTQNEVLYRPTEHRQNISSWWLSLLKVETIQTTLNKSICRPQIIKTFFSPFQILEKIGPVAYKLDLPPSSMIHPVFHISLSKQHHCEILPSMTTSLRSTFKDNHPIFKLKANLDKRTVQNGSNSTEQILVHWNYFLPEEAHG